MVETGVTFEEFLKALRVNYDSFKKASGASASETMVLDSVKIVGVFHSSVNRVFYTYDSDVSSVLDSLTVRYSVSSIYARRLKAYHFVRVEYLLTCGSAYGGWGGVSQMMDYYVDSKDALYGTVEHATMPISYFYIVNSSFAKGILNIRDWEHISSSSPPSGYRNCSTVLIELFKKKGLLDINRRYIVAKAPIPFGFDKDENAFHEVLTEFTVPLTWKEGVLYVYVTRLLRGDNPHIMKYIPDDITYCIVKEYTLFARGISLFDLLIIVFSYPKGSHYYKESISWRDNLVRFVNPDKSLLMAVIMASNDRIQQDAAKEIYRVFYG